MNLKKRPKGNSFAIRLNNIVWPHVAAKPKEAFMDGIDKMQGQVYTLSNGEMITIKPVPFGKLSIFSAAVSSLFAKLQKTGLKLETISDWKAVFDVAYEEVLAIMALILGGKRKFFDDITIEDGLGLLDIIIAQNFNDGAKKNLRAMIERLSSMFSTSFKSSSAQDIAERPLTDTASKKSPLSSGA